MFHLFLPNPVQGHRQEKRWSEIQANAQESVKTGPGDPLAGIRAQVAFPILAVAPSVRHTGIVCLDGRLRPIVARSSRLRDFPTEEAKLEVILGELDHELRERAPAIVVVEHGFDPHNADATEPIAGRVADRGREHGCRVVRLSFADACVRIAGGPSARDTAVLLLGRYEALRRRIAPRGTPVLRHERWREAKPLMTAFALAHAVALEVLTASARPLGTGPPQDHHDYGNSFT